MGLWIICNGTDGHRGCPTKERRFTANIMAGVNRAYLAKEGWGRGLRKDHKRADLCPGCLKIEAKLLEQDKAKAEERKRERDEVKKARLAAEPRKRKSSPSAASAPVPAT